MPNATGVTLTWLGQAGFLLRSGGATGATVLVDAFLSEYPGRRYPPPLDPATLTDVDLVLCTHEHLDHLDGPTVAAVAAASPQSRVVVPAPVVDQAVAAGVPAERVVGAEAGATTGAATGGAAGAGAGPLPGLAVAVWPLPAMHGVETADAYNFGRELSGGRTRYLGYVVELGGARIYHAGDTLWWPGQAQALLDLGVHVALLPINGRDPVREAAGLVGNIDHREAALLAHAAGVDLLVPMHWDMFDGNRGFPDQLVAVVERLDLNVPVYVPGLMRPFRYLPPA